MSVTVAHILAEDANPDRISIAQGPHSTTYQFQPGDGTRYVVTEVMLSPAECRLYGCAAGSRMFSIMCGSNMLLGFCTDAAPHYYYIQEKLGFSEYTTLAWERFFEFIFHGTDLGPFPWKG